MKRIYSLCLILLLAPVLLVGIFLLDAMGLETSLLTKLFIVFVGTIIGFQSAPAVLMFTGLVKESCTDSGTLVNKSSR